MVRSHCHPGLTPHLGTTTDESAYNWDKTVSLCLGREPALVMRSGHSPDKITDESDDGTLWIPYFKDEPSSIRYVDLYFSVTSLPFFYHPDRTVTPSHCNSSLIDLS